MTDKIDELVELITKRVTERLQAMNVPQTSFEHKSFDCTGSVSYTHLTLPTN